MLNTQKIPPFTKDFIDNCCLKFPTPFYLYDERGIRESIHQLKAAFSWAPTFLEYFAVKATPTPELIKVILEEGCGLDASSLTELLIAERLGVRDDLIMFTSNATPAHEFIKADELGAIINLDDVSHLDFLLKLVAPPKLLCFRYNPGAARSGNDIIGKPEEAKFGMTRDQIYKVIDDARSRGIQRFGLHTMVASNELDYRYFVETAQMLFELVVEIKEKLGVSLEFVNLGGGIGIPYRPTDPAFNFAAFGEGVQKVYNEMIIKNGLHPLKVFMECGRMVTGPHGYLITKVLHRKETYKKYIGVDACAVNLLRPAMYGSYHHITVFGGDEVSHRGHEVVDVTGSLCENNDKFAINRELPIMKIGDTLVIHDCGAHGYSMGYNYNGKLKCAELLRTVDGEVKLIRRAETPDDYFATVNCI